MLDPTNVRTYRLLRATAHVSRTLAFVIAQFKWHDTADLRDAMGDTTQADLERLIRELVADEVAEPLIAWAELANYPGGWEAQLGTKTDGVYFSLARYPTCYRRGPWRLTVDVCHGENHEKWGCFDSADQPMRYYHEVVSAVCEAERIAEVLLSDRLKRGPISTTEV